MMQLCTVNAEINDCMHFFHLFIFSKAQCAYLTSSIIGDKKWSGHNYYVTKVTSVSSWLDAFPLLLLFFFFCLLARRRKGPFIYISELRSCVKVKVAVLGSHPGDGGGG